MNNALSLIFLGEARTPIWQLISGFLSLLIYGRIFLRGGIRVLLNRLSLPLPSQELQNVKWCLDDRKMSMSENVTKSESVFLKKQMTL